MSSIGSRSLAFTLACAVLFTVAAPLAFAEEKTIAPTGSDISVIMGATGSGVARASVYLDGTLAGTTDSKGNFTFTTAPAAGTHTVTVSAKGIKNATASTDFATKPVVIKAEAGKGKSLSIHVTDAKSKMGLADAKIVNGKYVVGSTDASGDLKMADFPMGIYLVKIQKDGYRTTTTLLIVLSNRTSSYALSPTA
ncbi:MAG TPA: carboxypeptidase regulatory-like domain-containing protein [Methanocella sp.]|uniref:carboxypeptidase regulatory-like domain-containing protein n=1 Tax=Methanocella sp. TaxID=2052833 RepID=UPI002C6576DA|nr:carboxypeptidase regulatory-like domain-containing protein [Methanocella sp.]HTY91362.1 carboxypeptidase regulatory-like domain-containing protein [Methanocella sp.]